MPGKSPTMAKRPPQTIRKSARIAAKKDEFLKYNDYNSSESDSEDGQEYVLEWYEDSGVRTSRRIQESKRNRNLECPNCHGTLYMFRDKSASSRRTPEHALKRGAQCDKCRKVYSLRLAENEPHRIYNKRKPTARYPSTPSFIKTNKNHQEIYVGLAIAFIAIVVLYYYLGNSTHPQTQPTFTIEMVKTKFPNQESKLWKAVASGLNDTINKNYPTSYMFLHLNEAEKTTENLLKELSEYAVCQLSKCNNTPINFKEVFDSYETDYGSIITRYKPELENSGVMIVENLDQVPEKFALAFHSFCDEISPLVEKSAFFFTMKFDKFEGSPLMDVRYVEKRLREKWRGIKDDQLGPLLTRITAMLLRVNPEEEKI